MPRVFVVGAYVPHGGTVMAYHIGRLLGQRFGFDPVAVAVGSETRESSVFDYPEAYSQISLRELRSSVAADDVLVVNPSFSDLMLGLGTTCTKVCYVQHFNTFSVIDGFFDLYVSVSRVVSRFLAETYRLDTKVVPPFIVNHAGHAVAPWAERLPRILVLRKGGTIASTLLRELTARYERRFGTLADRLDLADPVVPQAQLLAMMQQYRYCLTLSPCEGFGLMPLEAMASGCAVVGFDGAGGRDYMRDGRNAAVSAYPDMDGAVARLRRVLTQERFALKLSRNGRATARNYGIERFYAEWTRTLHNFFQSRTF